MKCFNWFFWLVLTISRMLHIKMRLTLVDLGSPLADFGSYIVLAGLKGALRSHR